jgi:hypothetical protein
MPEWVIALVSAGAGVLAALVPAWMQIRHERKVRAQDAASAFLGRLDGVVDAVCYALISCESGERDKKAVENAAHLSGELSTEVGRSVLLLGKGAAQAASEAFEELRKAALRLEVSLAQTAKPSNALREARVAYDDAQRHRLELIESLQP